jgi:CobW/HypB/UreG family nucleotide-binding protein
MSTYSTTVSRLPVVNSCTVTRPRLVLVGGFLGAGKTTLLLAAAARLQTAGRRVAIITNDQGGELVDTRFLRASGLNAGEVTGGCFCCRFSDFIRSAEQLLSFDPDVIFAEPVGSCTDLSATILQPLKKFYGGRFRLAPLTVLVEPRRAAGLLAPDADPHFSYLFRKQLAEADLVLFSKADRGTDFPSIPGVTARPVSALTGHGIGEWLDNVLNDGATAAGRLVDVDYARYAEAEAALGWLNWQADMRLARPLTPAAVAGPLIERLDRALTDGGISIAHLKVFVQSGTGYLKAGVCANGEEPSVDGALDAPPASRHELVLNLRAGASPERLDSMAQEAFSAIPGRLRFLHRQSFRPSPPVPEHRFSEIL